MKYVLAALLFLSVSSIAQLAPSPLNSQATNGAFFLNIDDSARIFVNGVEAHYNKKAGKYQSKEVALKPGDHIVVQLKNDLGTRYFMMAFLSTDKKTVVSFNRTAFKPLPVTVVSFDRPASEPIPTNLAKDFTDEDFAKISKYAKADTSRKRDTSIPFKHTSEYIWGESDECALACVLTSQMFMPAHP